MNALTFARRTACISCSGTRVDAVWATTYTDRAVASYMDSYSYAVDWRDALSECPISLLRCFDCDALFHEHILDSASLETLYSTWIDENQVESFTNAVHAESESAVQFENATKNVRHLLRLNHLLTKQFGSEAAPWRILDFGCGAAEFLKQADLFGFSTWGVDFSSTRASQALNQQISILSSLEEFHQRADEPVHVATMFQVLEHVEDPKQVLTDLALALEDGGFLIVEVPDCSGGSDGVPTSFEEFRNVHPLEHINAFTPDTLTALVEAVGFRKINPGPAHVTNRPDALVRGELTRLYEPKRTNQYFQKGS